jgi:NifU-like protein involved in Fe-S cluster formation
VGPLQARGGPALRGEAGQIEAGAWVVFEAIVENKVIGQLVFQAYGCPYVIAACCRVTELLRGCHAGEAAAVTAQRLAADLDIPVGKLASLLIIQDALRNCFRDWDTTPPAVAP